MSTIANMSAHHTSRVNTASNTSTVANLDTHHAPRVSIDAIQVTIEISTISRRGRKSVPGVEFLHARLNHVDTVEKLGGFIRRQRNIVNHLENEFGIKLRGSQKYYDESKISFTDEHGVRDETLLADYADADLNSPVGSNKRIIAEWKRKISKGELKDHARCLCTTCKDIQNARHGVWIHQQFKKPESYDRVVKLYETVVDLEDRIRELEDLVEELEDRCDKCEPDANESWKEKLEQSEREHEELREQVEILQQRLYHQSGDVDHDSD